MLEYDLDIDKKSKWFITTETDAVKDMPFYLTELGDFYAGSDFFTERDNKSGYQLIFTAAGSAELTINDKKFDLPLNSVVVVKCNTHHRYEPTAVPWNFKWIHFGGSGADALAKHINDESCAILEVAEPEKFTQYFSYLATLAPRNDLISSAQISNDISDMLTQILINKLSLNLRTPKNHAHYTDIRAVIDFVHKNYRDQISIDDMTNTVNISKYHFIRLFKKQMGTTPYEYLVNYRINQAKIMLRSSNKSVYEISYEVGYLSKSNFTAQFKSIVGLTPAKYRAENTSSLTLHS
ncbi:MAG: AraC family transcriptional regulator [Oscillospiraceae bacterium]